ncbi:MAG: hypothetical protein ACI9SE_003760 [Neolewinella sp.]|jgi:uncharacterized protein YceH (UPF0502 family)
MINLDRTEQRIVAVLIEKQRTVPDSYPMTEKALITGCNQSSNRDPVMDLQQFEVAGALMAMHGRNLVVRIEGGSRSIKYRHRLDEVLGVSENQLALLAELMMRGPQAPGALKPRVARMGFHGTPQQVEEELRELAAGAPSLVTQEARRPRERDHRWRHLLGDGSEVAVDLAATGAEHDAAIRAPATVAMPAGDRVMQRLEELERRIAHLERALGESALDDAGADSNSDDSPSHDSPSHDKTDDDSVAADRADDGRATMDHQDDAPPRPRLV